MKQLLDSGKAASVEEAEAVFNTYRLDIAYTTPEADEVGHQIALLTTVALARRAFLGGVYVRGPLDTPLLVLMPLGTTLREAVGALGGFFADQDSGAPQIYIGGGTRPRSANFQVRTVFAGWRGGILPAHSELTMVPKIAMPLSPMLASALAVNEAFLSVQESGGSIGKKRIGLSLWDPSPLVDWLTNELDEPDLRFLPTNLWLLGLGHLGQAYLWGLSLLPYKKNGDLTLVLQDTDDISSSSESTSVLSDHSHIGEKKTRLMADWCTRRGFRSRLIERIFDSTFRRQFDEPTVALCGFDNLESRWAMENAGFSFIVEAGLGQGYQDFRSLRIHTLPTNRPFAEIWKAPATGDETPPPTAYKKMLNDGVLDGCGITRLAGKAVGAPFVGCTAACLVLSEVLRQLHGGRMHDLIDLNLLDIEHRAVVKHPHDFSSRNPGFVDLSVYL